MEEPPIPNSASPCSEKNGNNKAAQCSVISVYQTTIAGSPHNVRFVWCKSLINHSLSVSIESPLGFSGDVVPPFTLKVDLKPWPFWGKKGFKSFEIDGHRVDVFWDLRSAKFSNSPEPSGGYYVALVSDDEVILLLGDCKKEAYKRTKSRPSLEDARLLSKRENVFGKRCFSTRAKFDERNKKEHDIVVENSISMSGPKDPEMWISIDGVVLIHVNNLQWKFRGNETVMVEQSPVQVFWDVHEWLFGGSGSGHALFIFKPGAPEPPEAGGEEERVEGEGSSMKGSCGSSEFCFYLYAWKVE